jgi:hypothetical protein
MKAKRPQSTVAPPPPVISEFDQAALTNAYKTGLILGWKRDSERGYRLTLEDQRDDYVEIAKLTSYLEKLAKHTS